MNRIRNVLDGLAEFFQGMAGAFRQTSTGVIEFELRELENLFGILVMGALIGLPTLPTSLTLRLLPYMLRELTVMNRRAQDMDDIFGEVAGMFEI